MGVENLYIKNGSININGTELRLDVQLEEGITRVQYHIGYGCVEEPKGNVVSYQKYEKYVEIFEAEKRRQEKELENLVLQYRRTSPISMRQCRLKLLLMGLLASVEGEMQKDKALSIEWEYATEIAIDNPLVLMLSEKLGLDDEARITMFEEARLL
jgi:hypothetical protein